MCVTEVVSSGGSPTNIWKKKVEDFVACHNINILEMDIGQPDHRHPPQFFKDAEFRVINMEGNALYTSVDGDIAVRISICNYVKNKFNLQYNPENIVLTSAKEGIYLAVRSELKRKSYKGKGVLVIDSDWPSYETIVEEAGWGVGGKVFSVRHKKDFSLPLEGIREVLEKYPNKIRMIIINSPNNPSGVVYTYKELEELAAIAIEYDLTVVSDEIYARNIYNGVDYHSIAEILKEAIVVNGFSKCWDIPGNRVGYVCAPKEKCKEMTKIKSNIDGNLPTFFQFVVKEIIDSPELLEASDLHIEKCNKEYWENIQNLCKTLEFWGVKYVKPSGALYVLAGLPKFVDMKSEDYAERLLEEGVSVMPGGIFCEECDGLVRICIATYKNKVDAAIKIIERFHEQIAVSWVPVINN